MVNCDITSAPTTTSLILQPIIPFFLQYLLVTAQLFIQPLNLSKVLKVNPFLNTIEIVALW